MRLPLTIFLVRKGEQYGILNKENKILVPIEYEFIAEDNRTLNCTISKEGLKGVFTVKGKVLPVKYEDVIFDRDYIYARENGKYGIWDKEGEMLYAPQFEAINGHSENYICAKKEGVWLGFKDGVLVDQGKEVTFIKVDQVAHYTACKNIEEDQERIDCANKELLKFIYEHVEYPEAAVAKNIEGIIIIAFDVEIDGSLTNIKMLRDIEGLFERNCTKLIHQLPAFQPAIYEGESVKMRHKIPIRFRLSRK